MLEGEETILQSMLEKLITKFKQDSVVINASKYVVKNFTVDDCLFSLSNYGRAHDFTVIDKERGEMIENLIQNDEKTAQERCQHNQDLEKDEANDVVTCKDHHEVKGLYEGYFSSSLDPVHLQLVHVLNWNQRDRKSRDARFLKSIKEAGLNRDAVDSKLRKTIQDHKSAIANSEEAMMDIRNDLFLSLEHILAARVANSIATRILNKSYLKVTRLKQQKDDLVTVEGLLLSFQLFSSLRKSAQTLFLKGEVLIASQCYLHLLAELVSIDIYAEFDVTRAIRSEILDMLPTMSRRSEKMLELICSRRFNCHDAKQYEGIIQSFVIFEQMQSMLLPLELHDASSSSTNAPIESPSSSSLSLRKRFSSLLSTKDLPEAIFTNVCNDISYCARNAVLEGVYAAGAVTSEDDAGIHVHLVELSLDKLVKRVSQNYYADCILRCAELLTMSLDTYNDIIKWHQTYIEDDNHDNKEKIFDMGVRLRDKRALVWNKAETCLCTILKSFTPTLSLPLNDFKTIERVVGKLNLLGTAFCGRVSEISSLSLCMKEISSSYLLEKEDWTTQKKRLDKDIHAKQQEKAIRVRSNNNSK